MSREIGINSIAYTIYLYLQKIKLYQTYAFLKTSMDRKILALLLYKRAQMQYTL